MQKKKFSYVLTGVIFMSMIMISACKKDSEVNPFDDAAKAPENTGSTYSPDANSFEYLYTNVFKPTCANSGCHDGSFEPDFRTISSAYNTLVYQPVIINDASLTYTYRVLPGNSNLSLLKRRLLQVPSNSIGQGRMPWIDTNWYYVPQNRNYIQNIVNWIDGGAKDLFGNIPTAGNKEPKTMGLMVFPTGNTTGEYVRGANDEPISVPANSIVDIWTYITDDSTSAQNMVVTDIKFSTLPYDFTNAATQNMVYDNASVSGNDFLGAGPFAYTHKLTSFDLSAYPSGSIVYIRTYVRDTSHSYDAEIPNNGTVESYLKYYTIKII